MMPTRVADVDDQTILTVVALEFVLPFMQPVATLNLPDRILVIISMMPASVL